jgi:hypothetical protein
MKRIVEFPLENGTSLQVEINENESSGVTRAARFDGSIEKAQSTLEKSLEKVKPAAQFILQQLRSLSDTPDEIEVSFGLKLSAEAGIVLAAGVGMEANYAITLKWAKEKK